MDITVVCGTTVDVAVFDISRVDVAAVSVTPMDVTRIGVTDTDVAYVILPLCALLFLVLPFSMPWLLMSPLESLPFPVLPLQWAPRYKSAQDKSIRDLRAVKSACPAYMPTGYVFPTRDGVMCVCPAYMLKAMYFPLEVQQFWLGTLVSAYHGALSNRSTNCASMLPLSILLFPVFPLLMSSVNMLYRLWLCCCGCYSLFRYH